MGDVPGSAGAGVPQAVAYGAGAGAAAGATAVGAAPVPPPPAGYDAGTAPLPASAPGGDGGAGARVEAAPAGADAAPPRRGSRRFNATPVVLVLVLLLVGAGVVWAVNTAFSGFDPAVSTDGRPTADAGEPAGEETTDGDGAEEPAAPEPAPEVRPAIASGTALDPQGDENPDNEGEHPELAAQAYDGQPETAWYSRRYNSPDFAGLKSGIGYAITLEQAAPVQTIVVDTTVEGGNVEIRATSPDAPTEGEVLASGPLSPGAEFTFAEPVEAESLVLWFTELPQNGQGENRVEINELLVS
ncbi:hypothetical protein [Cellulosimicrobium sp. CUA-896]|uniref:hypothetical protein n=1 Tax=Cellulosimicrobium sp. CUA-896 TaxID=1517881 RepID=UPI00096868EE|nr:hypothetical protein [Cellulosimicrobium sp. CUA-896]OLT46110.1 hypothetical protein BJF88_04570 [Cellulosimicrobium sp. CUA-896]